MNCLSMVSHLRPFLPIDDDYLDVYLHHFLYIHNLRRCDGKDTDGVIDSVLQLLSGTVMHTGILRWDRQSSKA